MRERKRGREGGRITQKKPNSFCLSMYILAAVKHWAVPECFLSLSPDRHVQAQPSESMCVAAVTQAMANISALLWSRSLVVSGNIRPCGCCMTTCESHIASHHIWFETSAAWCSCFRRADTIYNYLRYLSNTSWVHEAVCQHYHHVLRV